MTREEAIDAIVPKLVDFYRPERIYLFGSSARGDYRDDSDLDFMVLLPDGAHEPKYSAPIPRVPYAVEVTYWHSGEFERGAPLRPSLPATVLREGRLLYDEFSNQ